MSSTNPLPAAYGRLTPDTVLEALDAVGLRGDGRILQLNSYENRVFRLMLEDGGAHRISVSPWLGGRDPDVESPQAFERLGRLIGRVHAVGATQPFAHRLTLCPALGLQAIDTLVELQVVDPGQANPWESAARTAMEGVARAFERSDSAALRLHGDAHRGNLLEREQTLHLVDFDDACNGPAMQDLWLFLDGHDGEDRRRQLQALLRGYEDFMPFDDAQLALIEPLRTLRMLCHSAWVAQRWADPAFPIAFPGFGTPNHWADQTALLNEQIDRMG